MMSPPITPPATTPSDSPKFPNSRILGPDCDPTFNHGKSDALIAFRALSLQTRLRDLKDMNLGLGETENYTCTSDTIDSNITTTNYHSYLRICLVTLEELNADDDIQFALESSEAFTQVGASLDRIRPVLAASKSSNAAFSENANAQSVYSFDTSETLDTLWQDVQVLSEKVGAQVVAASDWVDCQQSLDAIHREEKDLVAAIFSMQEQRHVAMPISSVELDVLATILEEAPEGENTGTPGKKLHNDGLSKWDRALSETVLKLTSKLSPLRASISLFAPRLDAFANRAQGCFPTAVTELGRRYHNLNTKFNSILSDFRKLKDELVEDKWLAVFRQVNKQATEMMNSLFRTMKKLDSVPFHGAEAARLVETFEMKLEHYGKSIPSVLSIMRKGLRDRATLNGEILRGHELLTSRWTQLSKDIAEISRRIEGARAAGVIHRHEFPTSQFRSQVKEVIGRPEPSHTTEALPESSRKSTFTSATPQRLARSTRRSSPTRSYSPSPAVFRKDISLDPPRSRSRLAQVGDRSSLVSSALRPPWNSGTVARVSETGPLLGMQSPLRTISQSSLTRVGATSSLGLGRSQTPSGDHERRMTTSLIPLKSPHRLATGRSISSSLAAPPMPATPSKQTIDRLSRPKVPAVGIGASRVPPVPITPSGRLSSLARPKTPTSIPLPRRMVSNPQMLSGTSALRNNQAPSQSNRPASALAGRRQSGIPLPSPQKQTLKR